MLNKFIKNKKGEAYFSLSFSFLIIMLTFIIIVNAMPVFTKKQDLDLFAKTIVRQAELDGTVEQDELYEYLCDMYGITPTITWEWDKFENSKRVQLNRAIKVVLEDEFTFDVSGMLSFIKIPLKSVAFGKSEIYWK